MVAGIKISFLPRLRPYSVRGHRLLRFHVLQLFSATDLLSSGCNMVVHNSAAKNLCADQTLYEPCFEVTACKHSMVCKSDSMQHSSFCCAGDGQVSCTPSSQLLMSNGYTTDGIGTLSCDQGQDIVYPEGAPGFVYDPTGFLITLPGRQVHAADAHGTWHPVFSFLFFFFLFLQMHMVGCPDHM